jgi:hypothetical protein
MALCRERATTGRFFSLFASTFNYFPLFYRHNRPPMRKFAPFFQPTISFVGHFGFPFFFPSPHNILVAISFLRTRNTVPVKSSQHAGRARCRVSSRHFDTGMRERASERHACIRTHV